jgi:hypothetical protein
MIRSTTLGWSGVLLASLLGLAACGGSSSGPVAAAGSAGSGGAPSSSASSGNASSGSASSGSASSGAAGKSLASFDACSVVSDSEYVQAITAQASDPSALGTVNATHAAVDGSNTGLPGAKACRLSYTTTDSAGRVSQGGDPVIVTFDEYNNLGMLQGSNPISVNGYESSGATAFEGPGDAGDPHLTKDGYLFRMSGNSDLALLKTIALGIASRL